MVSRGRIGYAKAFEVNIVGRNAGHQQTGLGLVYHRAGAADERGIDRVGRNQRVEKTRHPSPIETAIKQVHVLLLARKDVVEHEARHVAVFQVLEHLGKHHAGLTLVAIDQREAALRFGAQRGLDQRQDGRDAAAGGKRHIVLGVRGVERGEETPFRRHDLEHVTHLDLRVGPSGETPTGHLLDCHPEFVVVHSGANRVRAAQLLTVDLDLEVEVLALHEAVILGQFIRHLEAQADRIRGFAPHFGHLEWMESGRHVQSPLPHLTAAQIGLKYSKGSRQLLHR